MNFLCSKRICALLIILKQIAWREVSTTVWSHLGDQSWTSLIGRNNEKYDKILHRRMELSRYNFNSICMCNKDNVHPDTQLHSDYAMTYQDQKVFLELQGALSFCCDTFLPFLWNLKTNPTQWMWLGESWELVKFVLSVILLFLIRKYILLDMPAGCER